MENVLGKMGEGHAPFIDRASAIEAFSGVYPAAGGCVSR